MRQRGQTWNIVRKVPAGILHCFSTKQIWRSLKTKDLGIANSRYAGVLTEIENEFEQARLKLLTEKPNSLDMIDTQWIVKSWFERKNQELNNSDIGFADADSKQERIDEMGLEFTMWQEDDPLAYLTSLQSAADRILMDNGIPSKPLSQEDKKRGWKKSYQANVDKSEIKYKNFTQLIRRGFIELCERELELLGVKIERSYQINFCR